MACQFKWYDPLTNEDNPGRVLQELWNKYYHAVYGLKPSRRVSIMNSSRAPGRVMWFKDEDINILRTIFILVCGVLKWLENQPAN